ncbi:MAG: hypothetical protein P4L55_22625 [Syntrophobacteraceae bacterium]|nr:hypothetical protein [Syntrophobacteraceae bacterium]
MKEQLSFVYMAYGGWQFRRQALLSVLSLVQSGAVPGRVLVYTDRPDEFEKLPVETVLLDKGSIKSWKGPYGFSHRMKIELLRSLFKEADGHVVYVDSDTIWTREPAGIYQSLREGCAVMHVRERQLSDRFFPQYRALLENTEFLKNAGLPVVPTEQFWVYNAGVLGLPSTMNPAVLDETLYMCDLLCRKVPLMMEWVEQTAFSYIFQGHGMKIDTCGEELFHYWADSFEFARRLKKYSLSDLAALSKEPQRVYELIGELRKGRRSFVNQLLVRTKRLWRSARKRKRESLVYLDILKCRALGRERPDD